MRVLTLCACSRRRQVGDTFVVGAAFDEKNVSQRAPLGSHHDHLTHTPVGSHRSTPTPSTTTPTPSTPSTPPLTESTPRTAA